MVKTVTITQEKYEHFMELEDFIESLKMIVGATVKPKKVRKPKQDKSVNVVEKFKNHRFTTRVDINGNEIHKDDYTSKDRFYVLRVDCDLLSCCAGIEGEVADVQLDIVDKLITVSLYTFTTYGTEVAHVLEYSIDKDGLRVLEDAVKSHD